jgi:lipoprotein-releasing system permease protein
MASYEWLIGTRYLRSAHRRGFVSFVALISVAGLMLGVAVLIVVLSVMNGFERELRARASSSVTSHATLMGLEGALPDWRACARGRIAHARGARSRALRRGAGDARERPRVVGSAMRGVDPAEERKAVGHRAARQRRAPRGR